MWSFLCCSIFYITILGAHWQHFILKHHNSRTSCILWALSSGSLWYCTCFLETLLERTCHLALWCADTASGFHANGLCSSRWNCRFSFVYKMFCYITSLHFFFHYYRYSSSCCKIVLVFSCRMHHVAPFIWCPVGNTCSVPFREWKYAAHCLCYIKKAPGT